MPIRPILLIIVLMLIPGIASAEYYKYRDENGVVRYTDNLLEVPRDQHKDVKQYTEIKSSDPDQTGEEAQANPQENREERAQALRNEHEQLNQAFQELEAERKIIAEKNKNPKDQAEFEAFKKRVDDYNARIQAYEVQRDTFQKKVDAFNAELDEE